MALNQKDSSNIETVDSSLTLAAAIAKLAEATSAQRSTGLTVEQFAETLRNERKAINPNELTHNGVSAFSYPEGDKARPKPKLSVTEVYENGTPLREDMLTPQEIDSYNSVMAMIPKAGDRLLAWDGQLKAERTDSGRRVYITFPTRSVEDQTRANTFTILQRNLLLTDGEAAANPNTLIEQMAEMKRQIAELTAARQPVGASA